MSAGAAAAVVTPRRRRLFLGITIALPWIILLAVELGLRAGGYGGSYPLFVPHPAQPEYLVTNRVVGWRYFGNGPFIPTPELDLFHARKQPGSYRIFMQGESSAQGYPYGHGGAPSRMLEQRLQAALPDREVEVINTALTAVNSWTLLDQADEIIAQQPDAVLIYTGHNEYYGAFGAGSARSVSHWRPVVKAMLMIRHVRVAQLMGDAMHRVGGMFARRSDTAAPRTVMQLMAGDMQIPYDSPRHRAGIEQFRTNLGALLARYRAHGIPVFIGTLASNERDQPPLAGGNAASDDDSSAASYYALARQLDARGDSARAREAYRAAKERDQLPFRAPEAMNAVIREEAARYGATVVETQRALEARSPGAMVGATLMLEHLHPNLDGYSIIAGAFHAALLEHIGGSAPASAVAAARARADLPVTELDSLIGLLRTDRLVAGWPFRAKGAERIPIVDTLHPTNRVEHLAQAVVTGDLPWPEATERLRASAEQAGEYGQSIRAARALAMEYSYSSAPYMDAARVALLQHHYEEALAYVKAANARRETAGGVQLAGLLMLRSGDYAAAIPALQRASALAPRDERIALSLRAAGAIPALERGRATAPRDTTILYDLGGAYAITQQYEKSRETLRMLTRVAPNHAGARTLMAKLPQ